MNGKLRQIQSINNEENKSTLNLLLDHASSSFDMRTMLNNYRSTANLNKVTRMLHNPTTTIMPEFKSTNEKKVTTLNMPMIAKKTVQDFIPCLFMK